MINKTRYLFSIPLSHDPSRPRRSQVQPPTWSAGQPADLGALLEDLERPPVERIGALAIDAFLPKRDRRALAAALNTLLASPIHENKVLARRAGFNGPADARTMNVLAIDGV